MPFVHELALKRFKKADDAESDHRKASDEDQEFYNGDQWPSSVKLERDNDLRPCLTINKQPAIVKQVTNEQRKNKPAIRILPFGGGADKVTAKMLTGYIRHIRNNSKAKIAYNTANKDQAVRGLGYIRVDTDYVNDWSFEQDLYINRVLDPNTIRMDNTCKEFDKSDADWAFILHPYEKEEYEEEWPDADMAQFEADLNEEQKLWVGDTILVAEYFYAEYKKDTLFQLASGHKVLKSQYDEFVEKELESAENESEASQIEEQLAILDERPTKIRTIMSCMMNGVENLEEPKETVWKWIPLVPVIGEENYVKGKTVYKGMVRDNKDPQMQFNYWETALTEMVALAPKNPYIGAEGSFKGYEQDYQEANVKAKAYLEHKVVIKGGQVMPAPQRQPFAGVPAGIMQGRQNADDNMRGVSGLQAPSMGYDDSRQRSEGAILALQQEGDTSTYDYVDNLAIALEQVGRILVDAIPKVVDTERMVRVLEEDGLTEEMVKITQGQGNPDKKLFNINTGTYDVVVSVGPAYATKRQHAADAMVQFTKNFPQMAEPIADLMVRAMDFPDAEPMAERLQTIIEQNHPGLIKTDDSEPMTPAQTQAMQMQLQELQQTLQQMQAELDDKEKDRQASLLESNLDNQTKIAVAEINAGQKSNAEELKAALSSQKTNIESQVKLTTEQIKSQTAIAVKKIPSMADVDVH